MDRYFLHERILANNVIIGLLIKMLPQWQSKQDPGGELQFVVMLAMLDTEIFCKYFDPRWLFKVPGNFPIELFYISNPILLLYNNNISIAKFVNTPNKPNNNINIFYTYNMQLDRWYNIYLTIKISIYYLRLIISQPKFMDDIKTLIFTLYINLYLCYFSYSNNNYASLQIKIKLFKCVQNSLLHYQDH